MKLICYWILPPLLFLTFILLPSERAVAQPNVFSTNRAAPELIEKVNELRASKDLPPYEPNSILTSIAQTHANYIASTGVLTHFDNQGKRPYQRAIAAGYGVAGDLSLGGLLTEAIYSGSGISDDDAISAWQANRADQVALLSSDYEDVGVAITAANGITYYVLIAASETDDVLPLVSPAAVTQSTGTFLPNTPLAGGEIYHVVQKDEALWSIAITYGTTIAELKILNGLAGDEIFEGQRLLVRRASTETPVPSPVPVTATLGLITSTATLPVTPTITQTPTPLPTPPATLQSGGMVVGGIVVAALIAAGLFSLLGRHKDKSLD
jgi:uncharacterized protein YkwD